MVHCPNCGAELKQVHVDFYRCPKCGRWWLVYTDREWGDLYAVVTVCMGSCETVVNLIKWGLVK